MTIRFIREIARPWPANACLVEHVETARLYVVSTVHRPLETKVFEGEPNGGFYGDDVAGGEGMHRCQAIRDLERVLANGG